MAGQRREEGRRRLVPSIDQGQGTSRVSGAAGRVSSASGQHAPINLETSGSSARQSTRSRASAQQSQKGKTSARTRKSSAPTRSTSRVGANSPDPKDTQFINWLRNKWSAMAPHQKQSFFSVLLLILGFLLFSTLTTFRDQPVLSGINKFFQTFLGWSAYPFVLGLIAFALLRLVEGIRRRRIIRRSMVVGLIVILLLLLVESRLIMGHLSAGVLAEVLVIPLLGWPAAGHVLVLGLLLVVIVLTFRLNFGHVLMTARFLKRLIGDRPSVPTYQQTRPSPSPGPRPQFSRYTRVRNPTLEDSRAMAPRRSRRRLVLEDEDEFDGAMVEDDESTIAFGPDFDDDLQNDINLHKHKVGPVRRGPRAPEPLNLDEHNVAVRGASQRELPFGEAVEDPRRIVLKSSIEMEALAPNPRKASNRVRGNLPAAPPPPPPVITSSWKVADTSLLHRPEELKLQKLGTDTTSLAHLIQETLRSFRVDAEVRVDDISIGPTIIRFGIRPTGKPEMRQDEKTGKMVPVRDSDGNIVYETRTRVSRIMALQNDLALVLEARTIRMEAPVPGRPYVGVEIPNKNSRLVTLREILESKEYLAASKKSRLALALGRDVAGQVRVGDLAKMPHVLIAGATGAGKCLAYDEPVFLSDGRVVKVQELIGKTLNVIGLEDIKEMCQVPVPATFTENGVQEVFEIELDNGIVLCRTGEHPLWAARLDENQHVGRQADGKAARRTRAIEAGWVNTKDLRVCGNRPSFDGHVILCPLNVQQQGSVSKSDADVVLCAALIAEGGLNRVGRANSGRSMGTPRFTNADSLMVDSVHIAAQEYGCRVVLSPSKVKGNVDYYISQEVRSGRDTINPIAQLVYDWKINCLATQKNIPEWVFQLPDEQIALFLRVFIDCDGWISVRGHRSSVNVSLANPVLVKQIGQLALRFGITGTYTYKANGFAGAWTWSTCMVTEWQDRVGSLVKATKLYQAVIDQTESRQNAATVWNAWRRVRPLADQSFADCPQGYEWRKIVAIRCVTAPTVNIQVHSENHAFVGYAVEHNSVMINTIVASFLTQATPDDVRMLMVDPKMVELSMYNGIPHLLSPVVTEVDKVVPLLKNAISEMERRYRLFSQLGVRNLDGYRKMRLEKFAKGDDSLNNLPSIVIIIDELADLMMAAPEEVEGLICRLAQLARATGIHLVIATQRPSVDVITGLIKANIPTRISFMVSSAVDSRTIIDMGGAERLLGRGDMLYLPADAGRPERIQAAFLTDEEAQALVEFWQNQAAEFAAATVNDDADPNAATYPAIELWEIKEEPEDDFELNDDLLDKAEEVVREHGKASCTFLQRRLRIGYSRAARLIDLLEERGVIGPAEGGGRGREILDGTSRNNGYGRYVDHEHEHSLPSEADDIVEEERARNEFLRQQAAMRSRQSQRRQPGEAEDEEA